MKKILPTLLALALLLPSTLLAQSDENSTTWSEYGAGTDPSTQDWTEIQVSTGIGCGDLEVIELQANLTDGLVLEFSRQIGDTHRCLLIWDESNASLNSEGLTAFRFFDPATNNPSLGISLRQQNGTADSYIAYARENGTFIIAETASGGESIIDFTTGNTINVDTWYWLRFRVVDTNLMMRVWEQSTSEPSEWDIETTDSSITTAGKAGLWHFRSGADGTLVSYIDNFAFSNSPITSPACVINCPGTGAIPEPGRFPIMSYDWVGELGPFAVFLLIIVAAVATAGILTAFGVPLYVTMPLAAIVGLTSVIITIAPLWILFAGMFLIGLLGLLLLMRQRSRSE